ncbi:Uncharacterised protein [uncultured archaeon]|nr:Uncharacterised protein [uncultured archaeon]
MPRPDSEMMSKPFSSDWKIYLQLLLFVLIGLAADQMPLNAIVGGAGASLTFFDIFVAVPVMLLGLLNGLAAILIAKLLSVLVAGKPLDGMTLLRLMPPLAAGAYFWAYGQAQKDGAGRRPVPKLLELGVPALMILLFAMHPAIFGTVAMLYALWWVIPIFAALAGQEKADGVVKPVLLVLGAGLAIHMGMQMAGGWPADAGLASAPSILELAACVLSFGAALAPIRFSARAYGTTFTQHAIGSVLFLYTVPALQNPQVWLGLIPVVLLERSVLGGGLFLVSGGLEVLLSRMTLLRRHWQRAGGPAEGVPAAHKQKRKK